MTPLDHRFQTAKKNQYPRLMSFSYSITTVCYSLRLEATILNDIRRESKSNGRIERKRCGVDLSQTAKEEKQHFQYRTVSPLSSQYEHRRVFSFIHRAKEIKLRIPLHSTRVRLVKLKISNIRSFSSIIKKVNRYEKEE